MSGRPGFSISMFYPDGTHETIDDEFEAGEAVHLALRLIKIFKRTDRSLQPAEKVIITDGGGRTVFEWQSKKGVTFP